MWWKNRLDNWFYLPENRYKLDAIYRTGTKCRKREVESERWDGKQKRIQNGSRINQIGLWEQIDWTKRNMCICLLKTFEDKNDSLKHYYKNNNNNNNTWNRYIHNIHFQQYHFNSFNSRFVCFYLSFLVSNSTAAIIFPPHFGKSNRMLKEWI